MLSVFNRTTKLLQKLKRRGKLLRKLLFKQAFKFTFIFLLHYLKMITYTLSFTGGSHSKESAAMRETQV